MCRVFLKNRPGSRPNRDAGSKTLRHGASARRRQQQPEDVRGQQPLPFSAPQPSSSSCVTDVTDCLSDEDEDEASSGSTARAAPQREA